MFHYFISKNFLRVANIHAETFHEYLISSLFHNLLFINCQEVYGDVSVKGLLAVIEICSFSAC